MNEHRYDTDLLFKALADASRRKLLDVLRAHDGRTLSELCAHLNMTRQGVTQHLDTPAAKPASEGKTDVKPAAPAPSAPAPAAPAEKSSEIPK